MLQQFYPQVNHSYAYELNKDMHFAAAHSVPFPEAGMCSKVHGHTYFVNITIGGHTLNNMGFLANFQDLKAAVHGRYDHTLMNNHPEFLGLAMQDEGSESATPAPSTEVVAETIATLIQEGLDHEGNGAQCLQVVVRETPTSYVVFRPAEVLV